MATDDSKPREWAKGESTILAEIRGAAARGKDAAGEGESNGEERAVRIEPLPRPGVSYTAHARPCSSPQMSLFLVDREYLPDGFAYSDLRRCRLVKPREAGKGPELVLDFSDAEVRIQGRKLHLLCQLIGLHLMPWVWEHPSPGDFDDDNATLIRKITITLKEKG